MQHMNSSRLLFVRPPRPVSLVPLYLAFAAIAVLAALALAFAWWPSGHAASDYRPVRNEDASPSRAQEGGSLIPSRARDQPGRTRRM